MFLCFFIIFTVIAGTRQSSIKLPETVHPQIGSATLFGQLTATPTAWDDFDEAI